MLCGQSPDIANKVLLAPQFRANAIWLCYPHPIVLAS